MSLYDDEDIGGPSTVSSWSRGKYEISLPLHLRTYKQCKGN